MQMRLQHIAIPPLLKDYIAKMWIFESNGPVPDADIKLIVPNGLIKLVIPFRNGLSGKMDRWYHLSKEHQITLIGICDVPSVVEAQDAAASGTIGVEFSPMGAYRFFHLRQHDIKNQIHPLTDILGNAAKAIEAHIANAETTAQKVKLLKGFLLKLFLQSERDPVFEYCIRKILSVNGGVPVSQLERETGYSSRWLNMKFNERIGVSPKNFCAITRFQFYYSALTKNTRQALLQKDFYHHYYDQAHFIKEFKRFTGLAPLKLESEINDFGRIFYRE